MGSFGNHGSEHTLSLDFIPLGCISLDASAVSHSSHEERGSQSFKNIPSTHPTEEVLLMKAWNALIDAGWIRSSVRHYEDESTIKMHRVYLRCMSSQSEKVYQTERGLKSALQTLIRNMDTSSVTWSGEVEMSGAPQRFDLCATPEDRSLFYIYNTLPSPSPSPCLGIECNTYIREAYEDLLDPEVDVPGLKTPLYPYQRRSVCTMLERESRSSLQLDPRLEVRIAPDGSQFYYEPRECRFYKNPRYYKSCQGGILSESMGLGKTLMALALILATKDHTSRIPVAYKRPHLHAQVQSLSRMAASSIVINSIPWKIEFERIRRATGQDLTNCTARIAAFPAQYQIPLKSSGRYQAAERTCKTLRTAATSLLIVPANLFEQWLNQIDNHVQHNYLRVLAVEDLASPLPNPDILTTYDIVMLTRNRLQLEARDGSDDHGRRENRRICQCAYIGATRIPDCHCVRIEDLYDSPLKYVHFKRLLVDEGHTFSNVDSKAAYVATSMVTADHRWLISGTPAKDLIGVELEDLLGDPVNTSTSSQLARRTATLNGRQKFLRADINGAARNFGKILSSFFQLQPWSAKSSGGERADWDEVVYRHEGRKRSYTCFSTSLRRTLENVIIKTRPADVEKDLELPPLSHEIVRLEPSFYDRLTANCFALVLTANAVTSERTDVDYIFHKNSIRARRQLVSNLRQSAFFWTGFSKADIMTTMKNCEKYIEKDSAVYTESDKVLLDCLLAQAHYLLTLEGWLALSHTHEMGFWMKDWPEASAQFWSFVKNDTLLMTGVSQLAAAQAFVNRQSHLEDPGAGLAGQGIRSLSVLKVDLEIDAADVSAAGTLAGSSIPLSSIKDQTYAKRKPDKTGRDNRRLSDIESLPDLAETSPFRKSRIVGTTSAKLSYLLSRIIELQETEKIIVFYEGDNVAYYIAQALDLLDIRYEIYAKSLKADLKSQYIVRFEDEKSGVRVLLMDVNQAAHGLNLPSASRIFFVNPVCRPNVEAQAIKRAHRIGQTRKVFVETLVLKGSVEEQMLERSRRMTFAEHTDAKTLEDDGGIKQIIQNIQPFPIRPEEYDLANQMAPLFHPEQLWGRPGWRTSQRLLYENSRSKRRKLGDSSVTSADRAPSQNVIASAGTARDFRIAQDLSFAHGFEAERPLEYAEGQAALLWPSQVLTDGCSAMTYCETTIARLE